MANKNNEQQMNQTAQMKNKNRGNFANDPKRAAEAGRKGGQASHGGGRRVSE
jgi:general stress protein YciG